MSETWPGEWLRGVLGILVLRLLADEELYGYAIASRLAGSGLGTIKGGTLYPLLGRLEEAGLVTTSWQVGEGGPGRKFYALTDEGRAELRGSAEQWLRFVDVTAGLLNHAAAPRPHGTPH